MARIDREKYLDEHEVEQQRSVTETHCVTDMKAAVGRAWWLGRSWTSHYRPAAGSASRPGSGR